MSNKKSINVLQEGFYYKKMKHLGMTAGILLSSDEESVSEINYNILKKQMN